jgi:hypothetical protein
MGEIRNAHTILMVKYRSNPPFGTSIKEWEDNDKADVRDIICDNRRLLILTRIVSNVIINVQHYLAAVLPWCSVVGVVNIRDVPNKRKSLNSVI